MSQTSKCKNFRPLWQPVSPQTAPQIVYEYVSDYVDRLQKPNQFQARNVPDKENFQTCKNCKAALKFALKILKRKPSTTFPANAFLFVNIY